MRRVFIAQVVILVLFGVFIGLGIAYPERLAALVLSFLSGAIGGSLSLLKRIRKAELSVLKEVASSLVTTLMPFLYGGILALITYLLFLGDVLTGENGGGLFTSNLFPLFTDPPGDSAQAGINMGTIIQTKPQSVKDFALLLIWSVVAGYSEKFVDQILRTLEQKGQ